MAALNGMRGTSSEASSCWQCGMGCRPPTRHVCPKTSQTSSKSNAFSMTAGVKRTVDWHRLSISLCKSWIHVASQTQILTLVSCLSWYVHKLTWAGCRRRSSHASFIEAAIPHEHLLVCMWARSAAKADQILLLFASTLHPCVPCFASLLGSVPYGTLCSRMCMPRSRKTLRRGSIPRHSKHGRSLQTKPQASQPQAEPRGHLFPPVGRFYVTGQQTALAHTPKTQLDDVASAAACLELGWQGVLQVHKPATAAPSGKHTHADAVGHPSKLHIGSEAPLWRDPADIADCPCAAQKPNL